MPENIPQKEVPPTGATEVSDGHAGDSVRQLAPASGDEVEAINEKGRFQLTKQGGFG